MPHTPPSKFGKPALGGSQANLTHRAVNGAVHRKLSTDSPAPATTRDNPELDAVENEVEMERYQAAYAAAREAGLSAEEAREEAKELASVADNIRKKQNWLKTFAGAYRHSRRNYGLNPTGARAYANRSVFEAGR